ncbi:MAG TPA: PA-phosphatase, partial [Blastocatellia bacterium]|nr:PA-phosphatase [Blastocatellia bacterium]
MGASWFGASWFGSSGFGASWAGSGGGGGVPVFAMRPDQPLAEIPVPSKFDAVFRESEFDPDLFALTILPEFVTAQVNGKTWDQTISLPAPLVIDQPMIDELCERAVTERPEALEEILQQHENFQVCWMHLINITPSSHPSTFLLMKLAARVGELAMIVLKCKNPQRPRPSQVNPMLYPPVPVPGHPSYPAGHAVIGQLTSESLAKLLPYYRDPLNALAERVGINRVNAGLHFLQDV